MVDVNNFGYNRCIKINILKILLRIKKKRPHLGSMVPIEYIGPGFGYGAGPLYSQASIFPGRRPEKTIHAATTESGNQPRIIETITALIGNTTIPIFGCLGKLLPHRLIG